MNKIREKQISFILNLKPFIKLTSPSPKSEEFPMEGVRKKRIKELILNVLREKKRLTASQLGNLIGLSRTRCSEYLKELAREGKTEGVIIGREKYYRLAR
jgi:response regulator of citrate/malate metabolism